MGNQRGFFNLAGFAKVFFNEFKDVMKQTNYGEDFDSAKQDAFARIIDIKDMLEAGLRDFLRTERLIT